MTAPATPAPATPAQTGAGGRAAAQGPALAAAAGCGAGVAMQSRINGELGQQLADPVLAALVSFIIGLLVTVLLLLRGRHPAAAIAMVGLARAPRWPLTAGLIGALLITVSAIAAPAVGVALLTVALIAGQTTGGLLVDRAGLGPAGKVRATAPRLVGVGLCLAAMVLAAVGAGAATAGPLLVAAILVTGLLVAAQTAGLGRLRMATGDGLVTSLANFAVGTAALAVVVGVMALAGGSADADWPGPAHWWLYCGGLFGVVFVVVTSRIVRTLGVLRLGLAIVAGQLLGALLLDLIVPAVPGGLPATIWLAAGVTLAAVALTGRGRS